MQAASYCLYNVHARSPPGRDAGAEQVEHEAEQQGPSEGGGVQQDRGIDRGRVERHAVLLCEEHRVAQISKEHTQEQSDDARQEGDDKVLSQYLPHQFTAGGAEGTAHAYLADPLPQAALRHAAQVDGRHDKQDKEDDPTLAAGGLYVWFPVGSRGKDVLLLVVRTVTADELPAVLGQRLVVGLQATVTFFTDGGEVSTVPGQDGARHHAHQVSVPGVVHLVGRGEWNPYLRVGALGQGADVAHHTTHSVGRMGQQELAPGSLRSAKQHARHALGNDGHGYPGVESGPVVGLAVNEGKVKHTPEVVVGLLYVYRRSWLIGQADRHRHRYAGVERDGLGRLQRFIQFTSRTHTHGTIAAAVAPILVGDAAKTHVQVAIAVRLWCIGRHLYLLHHHHQHDEKDGQGRTRHVHRADERLLPQLCPGLLYVLLNHDYSYLIVDKETS